MTEFIYNNTKNIKISYMFFKLKYNYYLHTLSEENIDFYLNLKSNTNLIVEL